MCVWFRGDVWFGGVSFRRVWLGVCSWLKDFFAKHMVTNTEENENGRATFSPNGQSFQVQCTTFRANSCTWHWWHQDSSHKETDTY